MTFPPATHPLSEDCGDDCPRAGMSWWVINSCDLITLMEQARDGADIEDVVMREYMSANHTKLIRVDDEGTDDE